ncbi:MAG: PKD domain-containing protein [Candidatus Kapaibacterium sp.]
MNKLIILLVILFGTLFSQELPILDRLVITDTITVWTKHEGYQSSDFKISGVDYFKEIDTTYLIKNNNIGYLISSKDGSGYRIIDLPNTNKYKPATWDIPYDDINLIYGYEFDDDNGNGNFRITYKKNNKVDSIKDYIHDIGAFRSIHTAGESIIKMLSLREGGHFLYANFYRVDGPNKYKEAKTIYYNEYLDSIVDISKLSLRLSSIGRNQKYIMCFNNNTGGIPGVNEHDYADTYDYFSIENNFPFSLKSFRKDNLVQSNPSFSFINDSLSINLVNDSLLIYNFKSSTILRTYDISKRKQIKNYYLIPISNSIIFNSTGITDNENYITAIHLPSLNIIKDTINNKPYLSRILTKLASGEFLSVGFDNYLYKFNSDFGFDYAISDFNNELIGNKMIQFTDQSNGPIIKWDWDFGDGNTSEDRNPQHQYTNSGTYSVTLIVENEFGTLDTSSHEVIAEDKLTSFFSADILEGKIPHTVTFKNRSLGKPTRFIWNFGDGTSSKEENPTHTYTMSGTYGVSLTIFDDNDEFDMVLLEKLINVSE